MGPPPRRRKSVFVSCPFCYASVAAPLLHCHVSKCPSHPPPPCDGDSSDQDSAGPAHPMPDKPCFHSAPRSSLPSTEDLPAVVALHQRRMESVAFVREGKNGVTLEAAIADGMEKPGLALPDMEKLLGLQSRLEESLQREKEMERKYMKMLLNKESLLYTDSVESGQELKKKIECLEAQEESYRRRIHYLEESLGQLQKEHIQVLRRRRSSEQSLPIMGGGLSNETASEAKAADVDFLLFGPKSSPPENLQCGSDEQLGLEPFIGFGPCRSVFIVDKCGVLIEVIENGTKRQPFLIQPKVLLSENESIEPIDESIEYMIENINPINENIEHIGENIHPIGGNIEPISENIMPISENNKPICENIDPISENIKPISENNASVSENIKLINENIEHTSENIEPISENIKLIMENIEPINENFEPLNENIENNSLHVDALLLNETMHEPSPTSKSETEKITNPGGTQKKAKRLKYTVLSESDTETKCENARLSGEENMLDSQTVQVSRLKRIKKKHRDSSQLGNGLASEACDCTQASIKMSSNAPLPFESEEETRKEEAGLPIKNSSVVGSRDATKRKITRTSHSPSEQSSSSQSSSESDCLLKRKRIRYSKSKKEMEKMKSVVGSRDAAQRKAKSKIGLLHKSKEEEEEEEEDEDEDEEEEETNRQLKRRRGYSKSKEEMETKKSVGGSRDPAERRARLKVTSLHNPEEEEDEDEDKLTISQLKRRSMRNSKLKEETEIKKSRVGSRDAAIKKARPKSTLLKPKEEEEGEEKETRIQLKRRKSHYSIPEEKKKKKKSVVGSRIAAKISRLRVISLLKEEQEEETEEDEDDKEEETDYHSKRSRRNSKSKEEIHEPCSEKKKSITRSRRKFMHCSEDEDADGKDSTSRSNGSSVQPVEGVKDGRKKPRKKTDHNNGEDSSSESDSLNDFLVESSEEVDDEKGQCETEGENDKVTRKKRAADKLLNSETANHNEDCSDASGSGETESSDTSGSGDTESSDSSDNGNAVSSGSKSSDSSGTRQVQSPSSSEDIMPSYQKRRLRSQLRQMKYDWDHEVDMLVQINRDPELCFRAVCALYRQQTDDEKWKMGSKHTNRRGFDNCHARRGTRLAEYLTDNDPDGPVMRTVEDLEEHDSTGVEWCRKLAMHHSKQLFAIYKNREDPHFPFK